MKHEGREVSTRCCRERLVEKILLPCRRLKRHFSFHGYRGWLPINELEQNTLHLIRLVCEVLFIGA